MNNSIINAQFKNLLSFKDFENIIKASNVYKKIKIIFPFLCDYIFETNDDYFITITLKLFSDSVDNLSDVENELISYKYTDEFEELQQIETISKYLPVMRTIFKPVQVILNEPISQPVVQPIVQPVAQVIAEPIPQPVVQEVMNEEDQLTQVKPVEKPKRKAAGKKRPSLTMKTSLKKPLALKKKNMKR